MNNNASCDDNHAIITTNSEHNNNMTTPVHRRSTSGNNNNNPSPRSNSSSSNTSPSIISSSKINPFEITTSYDNNEDDDRQIATGVVNAIPTPPFNDDATIDDDIDDDELERSVAGLLSRHNTNSNGTSDATGGGGGPTRRPLCPPHCSCYKIGNTVVIFPRLYSRTGYGVVGPHWWGLLCTLGLIVSASSYFLRKSREIGEGSFAMCLFFAVGCCVALFFVACGDPGVIVSRGGLPEDAGGGELRNWRWCDMCGVYQPPRAAHCPECNVCVAGYDHHCPWMGTCVGRKNMKAFVIFNLSWLFYLIFAIAWVTILGPKTMHHVG